MRYRVYEAFTPHRIVHFLFLCFAAGRGLRTALGESLSASTKQNEVEIMAEHTESPHRIRF